MNTRYCPHCISSEPMTFNPLTETYFCLSCEHEDPGNGVTRSTQVTPVNSLRPGHPYATMQRGRARRVSPVTRRFSAIRVRG